MSDRQITFVKKILANGEACAKCADVEQRLRDGGHMQQVHRIVVADERDPASEGMRLAAEHGVKRAPFFLVREREETRVYTVFFKFLKEVLGTRVQIAAENAEILRDHPELDLI